MKEINNYNGKENNQKKNEQKDEGQLIYYTQLSKEQTQYDYQQFVYNKIENALLTILLIEQMNQIESKNTKKVAFADSDQNQKQNMLLFLQNILNSRKFGKMNQYSCMSSTQYSKQVHDKNQNNQDLQQIFQEIKNILDKQLLFQSENIQKQSLLIGKDDTYYYETILIFYNLLKTKTINSTDYTKFLKWICRLLDSKGYFDFIINSIKKKFVKLGFNILHIVSRNQAKIDDFSENDGQNQFRNAVLNLIKTKQQKIGQLRYEICRVCQSYILMSNIRSHIETCQKVHQKKYIQLKLVEKGKQMLEEINKTGSHSQKSYDMKQFFYRVFELWGFSMPVFKLYRPENRQEIEKIIAQYDGIYMEQFYTEIVDLLMKYLKTFEQCDQTLDDINCIRESKKHIYSKKLIESFNSKKSFHASSSSFQESSNDNDPIILSEKTIASEAKHQHDQKFKLSDFQILQYLGKGSYSEVFLVRKKNTKDLFAMKVIEIQNIKEQRLKAFKKQQQVYKSIQGGFNVKLYYSFYEDNLCFFLLDYACGGSFRTLLTNEVYLQEKDAQLYLANLVLAVDSIHKLGIIHRDLKPENIVIDEKGKLILTDFNLSNMIISRQSQKSTHFFGTPDYIAPQVLRGETANQMIDWFSIGVILYQMVIGVTPFSDVSPEQVFENILSGNILWPEEQSNQETISVECKNIINSFLDPNPKTRLGSKGIQEIMEHQFFKDFNWAKFSQYQFFFIPRPSTPSSNQNMEIKMIIDNKKKKTSIKFITTQSIIRYDILKSKTKQNVRSHRNSRFKLQKQLEALKDLPSYSNMQEDVKKHNSQNNFKSHQLHNTIGVSCKVVNDHISQADQ